jgi:hypothetical protein
MKVHTFMEPSIVLSEHRAGEEGSCSRGTERTIKQEAPERGYSALVKTASHCAMYDTLVALSSEHSAALHQHV